MSKTSDKELTRNQQAIVEELERLREEVAQMRQILNHIDAINLEQPSAGMHINALLEQAVETSRIMSSVAGKYIAVSGEYNGRSFRVHSDSNLDLIIRDLNRPSLGRFGEHGMQVVGPYPPVDLTLEDKIADAVANAKQEHAAQTELRERRAQQDQKIDSAQNTLRRAGFTITPPERG